MKKFSLEATATLTGSVKGHGTAIESVQTTTDSMVNAKNLDLLTHAKTPAQIPISISTEMF